MEEHVEVWTSQGKPSGKLLPKSEVHRKGLHHATIHVWCYTANGRILFQKRSRTKPNFPGLWDVSVAGHVEGHEDIRKAALREVKEELGISLKEEDFDFLGVFFETHQHGPHYIDREFHHCFLVKLSGPIPHMRLQASEVEDVKFISLLQCAEEIWGLAHPQRYVPHDPTYYKTVFRAIKERL